MADLSGSYFDVLSSSLNAGDSVDVDFEVQNIDFDDTSAFYVDFYLSDDTNIDTSDYFLQRYDFSSGLVGGSSEFDTVTLTLPDENDSFWLGDGTYTIGMIIDADDEVFESDEDNNRNTGLLVDNDDVEITVSTSPTNGDPTDIGLDFNSINENQPANTIVGTLWTGDPNTGDMHTYTLISGDGDTDNGAFTIDGDTLKTNRSFDFEAKNTYSIRVQTDDGNGGLLEKALTINVNDVNEGVNGVNRNPTAINLSSTSVVENQPSNTIVGNFSTVDPDAGDTHTYAFVAGTGDTDNGAFTIEGNVLRAKQSFNYEAKSSYSIRVSTNDGKGGVYQQQLTLAVSDVLEQTGTVPSVINFGAFDLKLRGDGDDNVLQGGGDNDRLRGKAGDDRLVGKGGNDKLLGQGDNDTLIGGAGNDSLNGGAGNDRLFGRAGDDVLVGGSGVDALTGGNGKDLFVVNSLTEAGDQVADFSGIDDLIDLRTIFAASQYSGSDSFARFTQFVQLAQVGSNTEVRIDADGNGTGIASTTLLTLDNVVANTVSARNFVVA